MTLRILVNGEIYSGMKAAAAAAGISRIKLCMLIKANKLPPNIIIQSNFLHGDKPVPNKIRDGKSIIINGVKYFSIGQASRELDISVPLLYKRSKGKAASENIVIDLDTVKRGRLRYEFTHEGVIYRSLLEAVAKTGIAIHLLKVMYDKQINGKADVKRRPPNTGAGKSCVANNVKYDSIINAVTANGKNNYNICTKIKIKLDKPDTAKLKNTITIKGVVYENVYDAMTKLDLSRGHIYRLSSQERKHGNKTSSGKSETSSQRV